MTPLLAASLTSSSQRFWLVATLMMVTNQRLVARSNRIIGSLVEEPLRTLVKNVLVVAFTTPSATPVVLLNDTMRLLTAITYCVGPTAPSSSGGNELVGFVRESVAPVKFRPVVCGANGPV